MKFKLSALMLMWLMCWASQSSAQPTRARVIGSNNLLAANTITPAMIKQLNEENKEGCEDVTLNYDKKSRELSHKNDLRHTGEPIKPEELVIQRLGELGIETKGQASSRLLQQPKLGILKTEKVKGDYYVSQLKNKDAPKGYIPVETKAYRYYLNEGLSPSIPMDKQGKIETNDWHMEDVVKFEITVNSKKFVVKYNIHISHDDSGSCWDGSKDDLGTLSTDDGLHAQFILESITEETALLASEFNVEALNKNTLDAYVAELAGTTYSFSLLGSPQITFRDLTGAAVGETVGEGATATITLDTDAAGHGWYIGGLTTEDRGQNLSTPSSIFNPLSSVFSSPSSDWLPTSNPNEWVARTGTDAAGKMDMLSVLLHEYGHALGIEHSADSHDYMATTLTPGMRRLPSGDEMQLMAQLAAEAREAIMAGQGYTLTVANSNTDSPAPSPNLPISMGFGISFLGLLRRNSSTSSIFANAAPAQYDIAANATHVNGNFAITPTPTLPLTGGGGLSGWETTGKVNANNGAAVLSEVATSQTRLNQVFVVGADDRYLSFTLSNIGLEGKSALTPTSSLSPTPLPQGEGLPSDAFEVALLNANTGTSLTAPIGLTRTDALLNIQANGAELKATGVTSVINPDGSRTYVVDLAGIAVVTAVNLSFDLIGFGNNAANTNSHVTVRDVRLTGAVVTPQANDDIAIGAEDTVMQIIALANDVNIMQANASFSPIVVAAPMHGTVSINADGSFSYTLHANYFGVDSFTYQLSDSVHQSNVATVNLTVSTAL